MSWLNNAIIYQIFIDRFAGFKKTDGWEKPNYLGGNIQGIIDKLPYIKNLGVNAIWISPFYSGVAYHGYHITDFYSVDKHFGSEKDIKKLIQTAHDQKIKVICDFVPNHCSNQHPYFLDATTNKDSKYRDWFIFDSWPNDYRCFLSYKELPKLNLDNEQVRLHLLDSARKWLGLGFDGFRIDHVIGLSNDNLQKIITPLRAEFPDAIFIGEAWLKGVKLKELRTIKIPCKYLIWTFRLNGLLYRNYVNILDGVLDFRTAKYLERYALGKSDKHAKEIIRKASQLKGLVSLPTFLDNHDMERFLFRCGDDVERLERAATLQFSLKEPAIIYYGTEIGLSQDKPFSAFKNYGDIQARKPMEWNISKQDGELLVYYQNQIKRKLEKDGLA